MKCRRLTVALLTLAATLTLLASTTAANSAAQAKNPVAGGPLVLTGIPLERALALHLTSTSPLYRDTRVVDTTARYLKACVLYPVGAGLKPGGTTAVDGLRIHFLGIRPGHPPVNPPLDAPPLPTAGKGARLTFAAFTLANTTDGPVSLLEQGSFCGFSPTKGVTKAGAPATVLTSSQLDVSARPAASLSFAGLGYFKLDIAARQTVTIFVPQATSFPEMEVFYLLYSKKAVAMFE